jgi:hypothetical protein
MHAVILKPDGIRPTTDSQKHQDLYICCHLWRVENFETDEPQD